MDPLIIEATSKSPAVILDAAQRKFEFEGESRPENATKFYEQITNWLEQYLTSPAASAGENNFNFKITYCNSTSSKYIFELLKNLEAYSKKGVNIKINWFYDKRDFDIKETGDDLADMLELPFNILEL